MPVFRLLTRAVPLFAVLLLCASLLACGGGGDSGSGDEIALLDFGADPTPVPVAERIANVGVDGVALEELSYLYEYQIGLEGLQQLNRDLDHVLKPDKGDDDVGLDWVVDVHKLVNRADHLYEVILSRNIPDRQKEAYPSYFIAELEIVQLMAFGRDRLMAAAIILGPSGRTVDSLSVPEQRDFDRLLRESGYFLRQSEQMLDRQIKVTSTALSGVRLKQ